MDQEIKDKYKRDFKTDRMTFLFKQQKFFKLHASIIKGVDVTCYIYFCSSFEPHGDINFNYRFRWVAEGERIATNSGQVPI